MRSRNSDSNIKMSAYALMRSGCSANAIALLARSDNQLSSRRKVLQQMRERFNEIAAVLQLRERERE